LKSKRDKGLFGEYRDLGKEMYGDLRKGNVRRGVKRDLRGLYHFYVDEKTRQRLASMSRFRRWLWQAGWLLRSLLGKLSPLRRLLLAVSLLFFLQAARVSVDSSGEQWAFAGVIVLLTVLALELKDKLIARDELETGRSIQLSLLPEHAPRIEGWELWLFTRPANDVGGDLVDWMRLNQERVGVILGDVSGKGLGAALLMSKLQATVRAIADAEVSLPELGGKLNRIMCRDGILGRFATLVYLDLGSSGNVIRLLNAGHPSPLIVRHDRIDSLEPVSLPVGVKPDEDYLEQRVDMEDGDLFILYSDGVTEAANSQDELFGEERLLALLPELRNRGPEEAGRAICEAVDRFAADEHADDDLSIVVIQRKSAESSEVH